MAPHSSTPPVCVPFHVDPMTWPQLMDHVRYWRQRTRRSIGANSCSQITVLSSSAGHCDGARIYALGAAAATGHQTIMTLDIMFNDDDGIVDKYWKEMLRDDVHATTNGDRYQLSREEEALHERLRANAVHGVTSYSIMDDDTGAGRRILFMSSSRLFMCIDSSTIGTCMQPKAVPIDDVMTGGACPLYAQMCPDAASQLIAFVCNGDIYLQNGSQTIRATHLDTSALSAGAPAYVTQEEFDRYTAMWWSPCDGTTTVDGGRRRYLLYEQIDESPVHELCITSPGTLLDAQLPMRYPLAGTANAISSLKVLEITTIADSTTITDLFLSVDLHAQFAWFEYLIRAGWIGDGTAIWAILMSREQNRTALILIPLTLFIDPNDRSRAATGGIILLYEESCSSWINAHNLTYFLRASNVNTTDRIEFLFSSEKHGYQHLYLHEIKIQGDKAIPIQERAITGGQWPVQHGAGLIVDESRGHVYFVANKVSPLEASICVASYRSPSECRILTPTGKSYRSDRIDQTLHINVNVGFVCWISSIVDPPACYFFRLIHIDGQLPTAQPLYRLCSSRIPSTIVDEKCPNLNDNRAGFASMKMQQNLHETDEIVDDDDDDDDDAKRSDDTNEQTMDDIVNASLLDVLEEIDVHPEIIEFKSNNNAGCTHYAMLMRPNNWQTDKTYPVVHYVYGGPGIQLVRNVWNALSGFQKFTSLGYVVVMIDGRGSANRGIEFESHLKYRIGTIEVADQVEGLQAIAERTGNLLDLTRVAMIGWSYGGYVSLLALAQRPDIYKACVAGGPVSEWTYYDTAYTERYLGLPKEQTAAYAAGSVLNQVPQMPDEADRLLILHGMLDENVHLRHTERLIETLIRFGKPYQLQIFPRERHGVRGNEANELMDATVLHFIGRRLQ